MQFGTPTLKEFQKSLTVNNYKLLPHILRTTDSFLLGNKWQINYLSQFDVKSFQISDCKIRNHLTIITKKSRPLSIEAENFIKIFKLYYENMQ